MSFHVVSSSFQCIHTFCDFFQIRKYLLSISKLLLPFLFNWCENRKRKKCQKANIGSGGCHRSIFLFICQRFASFMTFWSYTGNTGRSYSFQCYTSAKQKLPHVFTKQVYQIKVDNLVYCMCFILYFGATLVYVTKGSKWLDACMFRSFLLLEL